VRPPEPAAAAPAVDARLVSVTVESEPPGADVYFVPATDFNTDMLKQRALLAPYQIPEGPTNTVTAQRERTFRVVFELNGAIELHPGSFKVVGLDAVPMVLRHRFKPNP
jgi:hypothetical protein